VSRCASQFVAEGFAAISLAASSSILAEKLRKLTVLTSVLHPKIATSTASTLAGLRAASGVATDALAGFHEPSASRSMFVHRPGAPQMAAPLDGVSRIAKQNVGDLLRLHAELYASMATMGGQLLEAIAGKRGMSAGSPALLRGYAVLGAEPAVNGAAPTSLATQ